MMHGPISFRFTDSMYVSVDDVVIRYQNMNAIKCKKLAGLIQYKCDKIIL